MSAYLAVLFTLFLSTQAYWLMNGDGTWQDGAASYTCPTDPKNVVCCPVAGDKHGDRHCCPDTQEPEVGDNGGAIYQKLNIAVAQSGVDYSQTFLSDSTRGKLCSPFKASILLYSDATAKPVPIGDATIRWGGDTAGIRGRCLVFDFFIQQNPVEYCWTKWHAYISGSSIASLGSLPSLTGDKWISKDRTGSCGAGRFTETICPTASGNGAWSLPSCSANLFVAFRFSMSVPSSTAVAWMSPQVHFTGNEFDGDGVSRTIQSCPGICWTRSGVKVTDTGVDNKQSENGGTVTFQIDGNYLKISFTPAKDYQLTGVSIFLDTPIPSTDTSQWAFRYSVDNAQSGISPNNPRGIITATSFSVMYDLTEALRFPTGSKIGCGSRFRYAFSATLRKDSNTKTYHAVLNDRVSDNSPVRYHSQNRCCNNVSPTTTFQCDDTRDCYRVTEFKDDLQWPSPGTEVGLKYCCPIAELDVLIRDLLPERKSPYSGFTSGNVMAKCLGGDRPGQECSMSMTWLTEGAGHRNVVGYFLWDETRGTYFTDVFNSDANAENNGLGSLWPDTSALRSKGCLTAGDTIQVSVPKAGTVGWFLKENGADYTKRGSLTAAKFYSVTDYDREGGLINDDGYDNKFPDSAKVPTRHYGWVNIEGLDALIFGVEDLFDLGDRDYNDAVFGIKLNGAWEVPGLLSYDPCTSTVRECRTFDPYSKADYVFTPGCIPHIILDPTVGQPADRKECVAYYRIPDGWEIAPMDELGMDAAATFSTNDWKTPCSVGMSTTTPGTYKGWTSTGECTAEVKTIEDSDGVTTCYNLGCNGHLLLRQKNVVAGRCNADTYGLKCDLETGASYYTVPSTATPNNVYVNLVEPSPSIPRPSISVPLQVPLYNRMQIFTLIDAHGVTTTSPNEIACVAQTIPYLYGRSGDYLGMNVGYGYSTNSGGNVIWQPLTWDDDTYLTLTPPAVGTANSNNNIIQALTNLINSPDLGWFPSTYKVVYVVMKAAPTISATEVNALRTAILNTGTHVVFLFSSGTHKTNFDTAVASYSIPHIATTSITYPSYPVTESTASIRDTWSLPWISRAYTALRTIIGRVTVVEASADTSPSFSTPPAQTTITNFGSMENPPKLPDFSYYNTLPATFSLPAGYPGTATAASMPYTVTYRFVETGHTFDAIISWNEAPRLQADVLTYSFSDSTPGPYYINVIDSIRSKLDPNVNRLDITYTSEKFTSSIPTSGWVATATVDKGLDDGKPFELNKEFNSLGLRVTAIPFSSGTWELEYTISDGCRVVGPGKVIVTFTTSFVLPVCSDRSSTINFGSEWAVDLRNAVSETPLGSCSPATLTTATCSISGCTNCITGTGCCTAGTALGSCQSTATCPGGAAFICEGAACPASVTCVLPTGSTCNSATCFGSVSCTNGCPVGYQHGMLCYVDRTTNARKVCCAQYAPHGMRFSIMNDNRPSYDMSYSTGVDTWAAVTYNSPNAQFGNLKVTPGSGISGTARWDYRVFAPNNAYVQCSLMLTVRPRPRAPRIRLTPPTVETVPTNFGQWQVTIEDDDLDVVSLLITDDKSLITFSHIEASSFGVADRATYPSAVPISSTATTLLGGLDLAQTTVPGSISFWMQWKPLITHPYNVDHTVRLYARDATGLTSTVASVRLTIPKNDPPTWRGTTDQTTWPQYSSRFPVIVDGDDPNLADTEKLSITITRLPARGKLSIIINGVHQDVVQNRLYPNEVATGVRSGRTTMPLYYTPDSSHGTVKFEGYFSDPSGLQGPGEVTITLTPVPRPPTTEDVKVSTAQGVATPISIPASDVDGDLEYLIVTRTNFADPGTTFTFGGTNVMVGTRLNLAALASSSSFNFNYQSPGEDINDSFFYIAYDSRDAPSAEHQATIAIPENFENPTAQGDEFEVLEKESLEIDFVYGDTSEDGNHYFDTDGLSTTTRIRLSTVPTVGDLYDVNGVLVGAGRTLPTPYVLWVPPPGQAIKDPVTFNFVSLDEDSLVSEPATMTINVIPVDDPPEIFLTPDSILVDRLSTDTFKVTVSDPDSETIDVRITNINLPFGSGTSEHSTFEIRRADDSEEFTYTLVDQPSDNDVVIQLTYPDEDSYGTDLDFYIVWGPTEIAPDNTKGSFSLYAESGPAGDTLQSSKVTGSVAVTPNKIPYPVDNAEGTRYVYSVTEDTWPADGHTFDLVGSDDDPWHQNTLTVQLISLPTGVILTRPGSTTPLTPEDLPLDVTPTSPVDTTTLSQLRVLPVPGWSGEASFSFVLIDGLGAVSEEQKVTINVAYVNHPPTSADETLIIFQDSCIWFYCGAPDDLSSVTHAQISGRDQEEDQVETLTLIWETVPDSTTQGDLAFYEPDATRPIRLLSGTEMAKPDYDWNFWFQPLQGAKSAGCDLVTYEGCQPFATATFRVKDSEGLISVDTYTLTIIVLPVNAPPVGQDLRFTIKEDEELIVYWDPPGAERAYVLPVSDPDNTFEELTAVSRGIVAGSRGTWFVEEGDVESVVPDSENANIPGKKLIFRPPANQHSMAVPMSTMFYRVNDLQPLTSTDYMIQVYVESVPDVPEWKTPLEIRTNEDTQVLIQLNNRDVHWTSADTGDARIVITKIGKGTYTECSIEGCTPITDGSLPFTLKDGTLFFQGLQDEFGEEYSQFEFRLEILDENGNTNEIAQLTNTFTIHVNPVNDPPVLVPHWHPRSSSGPRNECDEDTYLRVRFTGTDIDSPLEVLTADILTYVDELQSALYTCTPRNRGGSRRAKKDCSDGPQVTTLQKIERIGVAEWELSFIPYPNWNGALTVQFMVWDEFLPSQVETLLVIVLPINDAPSIVKGATTVRTEFYEVAKGGGAWTLASLAPKETDFEVHVDDEKAKEEKKLEGALLDKKTGSPSTPSDVKDKIKSGDLVPVQRLRTQLQDIDFYFEYSLKVKASLIRAQWVDELIADDAPCDVTSEYGLECEDEITGLNNFLSNQGLPILVDSEVKSAVALFLLDDMGNVDKLNRPLSSGFTIVFLMNEDDDLTVPLAAVVILPVVAAVTAASIAAAWIMLGSKAQAYAGASFDAFAVSSVGTGTQSPLYNDDGRVINSPLYGTAKQ